MASMQSKVRNMQIEFDVTVCLFNCLNYLVKEIQRSDDLWLFVLVVYTELELALVFV